MSNYKSKLEGCQRLNRNANNRCSYPIPIDAKREEFRKYLEHAGVMDALTKVLVSLYEETEKPEDALEYVRKHLGGITESSSEIDSLRRELDESRAKIMELNAKLAKYEAEEGNE